MDTEEIFIKNVLELEVDGLKGINTYTIKAQYDVPRTAPNGYKYYELEHRLIDEFKMTWKEIECWGGISSINKEIKEAYDL